MDRMQRLGKYALDGPSHLEPFEKHLTSHAEHRSPLAHIKRPAAKRVCGVLLEWFRKDFLDAPTSLQSSLEGARLDSPHSLPFGNRQPATSKLKESVVPFVVGLLKDGGPTDVAGSIRAVVIYAVDLMSWGWSKPNITKKCREASSPLGMHRNPTPPIARVIAPSLVKAAFFDITPSCPLGRLFHGDEYTINFAPFKAV